MVHLPVNRCPVCDAKITQPAAAGRRRIYCSNRCRQKAKHERQGSCALPLEGEVEAPEPVEAFLVGKQAPTDDQVLAAVHEQILLIVTWRRLGHEARRQFAWRCAGMAEAVDAALAKYFKESS